MLYSIVFLARGNDEEHIINFRRRATQVQIIFCEIKSILRYLE